MGVFLGAAYELRLDEAVAHLLDVGADAAAQALLDQAYEALPKRLAQAPRIGREFIVRNPETSEVLAAWAAVRELLGDDIELREYILGDYLALYVIHQDCIHLLTLRHHRQCGFDFSEG
ncbi:TPA: hypothetical protein UOJ11_000433 [Stenotrophomonas maltophilia]|uniref:hypothetical protein n=1 Tax=Stenotrophomonas TaxID=40323 RepID=UPI000C16180A|nr:hypothetical protein [Stenotrophomonas maltophilia]PZS98708.1 hypothetical protein A7X66_05625 [Stenotrophomonas maltophilia]HDS1390887.1 hypothetical protein [Stenotrophomonas maltophilia]HDS1554185.1 hypothetical protein [Stenotrophomonas maltophilia]HEL5320800.1 hypothetical protein [Stenotrophomonas maltophilia]